jgi:hypothetical protein
VTGGWIRLHNEELHSCSLQLILLGWSNQGGRDGGHVAHMGEMRNADKILVGKPEDLGIHGRIILQYWKGVPSGVNRNSKFFSSCHIRGGDVSRLYLRHTYFKGIKCNGCIKGNNVIQGHCEPLVFYLY